MNMTQVMGSSLHSRSVEELVLVFQPWIQHLLACFGSSRCMFESNYPMDKAYTGYANLWTAFYQCSKHLGKEGVRDVMFLTAHRVYGLCLDVPEVDEYEGVA